MSQPPEWSAPDASGEPRGAAAPAEGTGGPAPGNQGQGVPGGPAPGTGPGTAQGADPGAQPGGWATAAWGAQPGTHSWAPTWDRGAPQPGPQGAPGAQQGAAQQAAAQGPYGGAPPWGTPSWAPQPPRPGIIPLRPIALGEIYDGAFRAIRGNPRTMIGIAAIVMAITTLATTVPQAVALQNFGESELFDPSASQLTAADVAVEFSGLIVPTVVPILVQALAITVVSGMLIVAVSNAVLGRGTSPKQLWHRTRGRVPALIGLAVLLLVLTLTTVTLLITPGVVLVVADQVLLGVVLGGLGLVLGFVAFIALTYGFWSLAAPALLLENLSVLAAMRRSWQLVSRSFWRVVGIMFLTAILVGFVSTFIATPFSLASSLITLGQDEPYADLGLTLVQLLIGQVGSILSGAVLYPLTAAVTALLYIDLRMRQEGLDLELIRAAEVPGR